MLEQSEGGRSTAVLLSIELYEGDSSLLYKDNSLKLIIQTSADSQSSTIRSRTQPLMSPPKNPMYERCRAPPASTPSGHFERPLNAAWPIARTRHFVRNQIPEIPAQK